MAGLEVKNLSKAHAGNLAVRDFSYTFAEGRITTILGPSGSGKSTTLAMLAGLTMPDSGQILWDGADITRQPAERRGFGLVFQSYALFPHLTVQDNIAFGLKVRHWSSAKRKARVGEMLELFRITPLAQRRVHQLSGGEQQRVALARALAFHPKLLLMDEPLSALDGRLRDELRLELGKLLPELGITTVYVTHDQVEALSLGHEVILLHQGQIEQAGKPREMYLQPSTLFAATFLGQTNVFAGASSAHPQGTEVQLPFGKLITPHSVSTHGACHVLIRPEHLQLSSAEEAHFIAVVESASFLGHRIRLTLNAAGSRIVMDVPNTGELHRLDQAPVRADVDRVLIMPRRE